jgi:hypothetical protein
MDGSHDEARGSDNEAYTEPSSVRDPHRQRGSGGVMALKNFNPATNYPDQVRWFDPLGPCGWCMKPATGKLMGPRNESYGAFCGPCAEKRLARARQEREVTTDYEKKKERPASDA